MQGDFLATGPGILHDGALRDVHHLLNHVQLAQHIVAVLHGGVFDQVVVLDAHIFDVANPVIGQAHAQFFQGRQHAAAAVVADHHQMLDLELVNGVLNGREAVQVAGHDDVGHVAVDKHLARLQPADLVGRHPAVRATNPHVFGVLLLGQFGEKAGTLAFDALGPFAVIG